MEATGVYRFCLYAMLEDHGIRPCLVNPREVQQVKGRKTDVQDCQWIQQLFVSGLLRDSIIPEGLLKELRFLVRERLDLICESSHYVNKMQRSLELMNIKLSNVIDQIQGSSGLNIIRAILAGERNAEVLLSYCHKSIRKNKVLFAPSEDGTRMKQSERMNTERQGDKLRGQGSKFKVQAATNYEVKVQKKKPVILRPLRVFRVP